MNHLRMLARYAVAFLFCSVAVYAQTVTGTITGLVTDQVGAVIPGASVVAHNMDTGVDSASTTDSAGLYRISYLPIGRYQVTVSAQGFGTQTVPDFSLGSAADRCLQREAGNRVCLHHSSGF